jgi:transcription elongation factor Elf1
MPRVKKKGSLFSSMVPQSVTQQKEHPMNIYWITRVTLIPPLTRGQDVAQIQQTLCSAVVTEEDMDQSLAGPSGPSNIGTGVNPAWDAVYFQCRSARTSGFKDVLISVSQDDSFGKKLTVQSPCIGSFEDYGSITDTFTGSRVMKGNATVNQSVSMSFDPSKLNCVSCGNEHAVITKNPTVVIFSDQNLVPTLSCNNGSCINIVRIENASLKELVDMASEIFVDTTFP